MGARDRVGIRLWYRTLSLYRLAESIPGLLKSLKIADLNKGLLACQNNPPYSQSAPNSSQESLAFPYQKAH
jgi:hypothetical protein